MERFVVFVLSFEFFVLKKVDNTKAAKLLTKDIKNKTDLMIQTEPPPD